MTRILVVDDNATFLQTICGMLVDHGYELSTAEDGAEALALLRKQAVDIVLTDIVMPNKEGIETIREIRKLHPACKIVAMSGGGRVGAASYLDLARLMGACTTIEKPFTTKELLAALSVAEKKGEG